MKELVEVIAKALVDNPDEVVVTESEKEEEIVIELKVAPTISPPWFLCVSAMRESHLPSYHNAVLRMVISSFQAYRPVRQALSACRLPSFREAAS